MGNGNCSSYCNQCSDETREIKTAEIKNTTPFKKDLISIRFFPAICNQSICKLPEPHPICNNTFPSVLIIPGVKLFSVLIVLNSFKKPHTLQCGVSKSLINKSRCCQYTMFVFHLLHQKQSVQFYHRQIEYLNHLLV